MDEVRRYDLYGKELNAGDPDSEWFWVRKPDYDEIEQRLNDWYRVEADIHTALSRRFGSEAVRDAAQEACSNLALHNRLLPSQPSAGADGK